ncbi:transporter, MotA/TolQ/ExbB proton channel family protein [Mobiluncus mulieris 28-1]|uniref:Transporter, MotA/TolQ/ExbB proton channel family protein n=2 Tax=Mobiluncus mulieris TaxID=2052 RepID=E0QNP8_9ACTO|nr:motility protein A [Mobiluncus mulieris]EEJ52847.1 transporter, MotA/TolQ/ExbB proton channel family protein [Mobiluncus mulieris ATCC 35243]EEZ92144.1 transporter, MotA/TolQ/ExbB proton channel family protein [Mobiluncus mulieris 28-1]EFM46794.1 transporter, MotA/TolQ/ExbB proton channel family protein [Mobiluncus mulieris ATCC 35239]EFN94065.1 transporter, MotA/TolQ/ExbB proton channel family protein [Mobiluncus mulieris FB024-16]MCU9970683.1 motility protein A [Mobiluncus mulieris]
MDPASIIGMVGAMVAVVAMLYMEGSHLTSILLPPPMILVFGGTLLATMATFTMKDFIYAFSRFPKGLTAKLPDPTEAIDTIVSLSEKARREGLLALEDAAKGIDDTFMREGLMSAIDGMDPEELREMLGDKIEAKKESDKGAYEWFKQAGGYSPTIGIIGTVVSLVHVLTNLSNPETLGPMIASAFVATLWGLLSANMIWLPMSGRLQRISQLEIARMEIITEGLISLQSGANPRQVGERLRSLIPPSQLKGGKEGKAA